MTTPNRSRRHPPQQSEEGESYTRLPQVILDRENPRHVQLLDVMQEQGFYRPEEAKKFIGYAELIRGFLFWYFGLAPHEFLPGAPQAEVPGSTVSRTVLTARTSRFENAAQVANSDDLVADYLLPGLSSQ